MANRKQSRGYCKYCGKEYTRAGMVKHMASCKNRKAVLEAESGKSRCGYFEILITGELV